jgi:hypothetical protein
MRLSIVLAISALVVVTAIMLVAGVSFLWAILAGTLAACAGFAVGMKVFVDQHHLGHTKSSVLRNASVQVNSLHNRTITEFQKSVAELRYDQGLAKSGQGDPIELPATLPDGELEETRVLTGEGSEPGPDSETPSGIMYESDYPPNSRFYVVDLTLQPTEKATGGHTHYEPDALELVIAQDPKKQGAPPPSTQDAPVNIIGVEVHDGARFLPSEEKLSGQQRLRIHFYVSDPRAKKLRLSYYFEQFGELNLPA